MDRTVRPPENIRLATIEDLYVGAELYIKKIDGKYSLHIFNVHNVRATFDQYMLEQRLWIKEESQSQPKPKRVVVQQLSVFNQQQ